MREKNLHFFGLGDEKSCFRLVPLMGVLNPSRSTRAESRLSLRRASTLVFGISRGPEPVDPWTTGLLTVGVIYIRLVGVADPVYRILQKCQIFFLSGIERNRKRAIFRLDIITKYCRKYNWNFHIMVLENFIVYKPGSKPVIWDTATRTRG